MLVQLCSLSFNHTSSQGGRGRNASKAATVNVSEAVQKPHSASEKNESPGTQESTVISANVGCLESDLGYLLHRNTVP